MEEEKIKTPEEMLLEKGFKGMRSPRDFNIATIVAYDYHAQFKQPPVSVMPSDYIEPELMPANDQRVWVNGRTLPVAFRIVAEDNYQKLISALSKEAPKEPMRPSCMGMGKPIQNDLGKWSMQNKIPNKERETAIEFAEWVTKNGFDVWRGNDNDYGKWNDGKNTSYYNPSELFDLFKQRNK